MVGRNTVLRLHDMLRKQLAKIDVVNGVFKPS
jgi:hypothetical protein